LAKKTRYTPLPRSFYARGVLTVARDAIGKILVLERESGVLAGRIVEAEAYRGPEDRAAHSFGGRRTARTEAMFGPPGHAYVFFVYGMHFHLNLVTTREGAPHAVLIRAVEPLEGIPEMAKRRGAVRKRPQPDERPRQAVPRVRHRRGELRRGSLRAPALPVGRPPRRRSALRTCGHRLRRHLGGQALALLRDRQSLGLARSAPEAHRLFCLPRQTLRYCSRER
jgi:DNA-3-methyladenine glycosylase